MIQGGIGLFIFSRVPYRFGTGLILGQPPARAAVRRIRDIEDLEEAIGGMPNFLGEGHQIEHSITVLWLSARNERLTLEQRLARAWARTREDVGDMFVLSVPGIIALAADILRNSGFILMPNEVEAYRVGDKAFEFKGTNGFMITVDINARDIKK